MLPDAAVQLLADEVVTRLASRLHPAVAPERVAARVHLDNFCRALISTDADAAMEMIRQERREGIPLETIYIGTLAVVARRLGELWEQDKVSFLQMSVAAGRIFEIMRCLRRQIPAPRGIVRAEHHALFATVPGELHTMGVTMAADLFRNRGWEIDLRVGYEHEELVASIADRSYKVIGLSAGQPGGLVALARMVVAMRITHPTARIFVGGHIVAEVPGLNALIAADGVASNWTETVKMMEELAALP